MLCQPSYAVRSFRVCDISKLSLYQFDGTGDYIKIALISKELE